MSSFRNKVADCRLRQIESPVNSTYYRRLARSGIDSLGSNQVTYCRPHWIETSNAVCVDGCDRSS